MSGYYDDRRYFDDDHDREFDYDRPRHDSPRRPRPRPRKSSWWPVWILIGGMGFLVGVCVLVCAGFLIMSKGHQGGVRLGHDMEQYARNYLADKGILEAGETVVAYYDKSVFLDGSDAAILTNRRIIYHKEGLTTPIRLPDVSNIKSRTEGVLNDTIIEIDGKNGSFLRIEIYGHDGGSVFVDALQREWQRNKR